MHTDITSLEAAEATATEPPSFVFYISSPSVGGEKSVMAIRHTLPIWASVRYLINRISEFL